MNRNWLLYLITILLFSLIFDFMNMGFVAIAIQIPCVIMMVKLIYDKFPKLVFILFIGFLLDFIINIPSINAHTLTTFKISDFTTTFNDSLVSKNILINAPNVENTTWVSIPRIKHIANASFNVSGSYYGEVTMNNDYGATGAFQGYGFGTNANWWEGARIWLNSTTNLASGNISRIYYRGYNTTSKGDGFNALIYICRVSAMSNDTCLDTKVKLHEDVAICPQAVNKGAYDECNFTFTPLTTYTLDSSKTYMVEFINPNATETSPYLYLNLYETTKTGYNNIQQCPYDVGDPPSARVASCGGMSSYLVSFKFGINGSAPTNPYIDVGDDGTNDWSYSGSFGTTNTVELSLPIQNYLQGCSSNPCPVPLVFGSASRGNFTVDLLSVEWVNETQYSTYDLNFSDNRNQSLWLTLPNVSRILSANLNVSGHPDFYRDWFDEGSTSYDSSLWWWWTSEIAQYKTTYTENIGFANNTFYIKQPEVGPDSDEAFYFLPEIMNDTAFYARFNAKLRLQTNLADGTELMTSIVLINSTTQSDYCLSSDRVCKYIDYVSLSTNGTNETSWNYYELNRTNTTHIRIEKNGVFFKWLNVSDVVGDLYLSGGYDNPTAANVFNTSDTNYVYLDNVSIGYFPQSPHLDVGSDSDVEWSQTGEYNQTQRVDISSDVDGYLLTCLNNPCYIPITVGASTDGFIRLDNLNSSYEYLTYWERYDTSDYENNLETFYLNFDIINYSDISDVNAYFFFNGSNHSYYSKIGSSPDRFYNFTTRITTPEVETDTNFTFYWSFSVRHSDATTDTYTTSSHIYTVIYRAITNCSTGVPAYNFTFWNEDDIGEGLSADVNMVFWIYGTNGTKAYTVNYTNTYNISVCIDPSYGTATIDAEIEYWGNYSGHNTAKRYYFFDDATIDNTTDLIKLYMLDISSANSYVLFTINDIAGNSYSDAILKVQRWYVSENAYYTVAMGKTDVDGNAMVYLRLYDTWYKLIVEKDGAVQRSFDKAIITSSTMTLYLTPTYYGEYWEYYDQLAYSCAFSTSTNYLTCTYTDTSGLSPTICMDVHRLTVVNVSIDVCSECSTSTSATLVCHLGDNVTGNTYTYALYGRFPETKWIFKQEFLEFSPESLYGSMGVFITLVMVLSISMAGIWKPEVTIFLSILAIIAATILQFIALGITGIIGLIVCAGILLYKMRG